MDPGGRFLKLDDDLDLLLEGQFGQLAPALALLLEHGFCRLTYHQRRLRAYSIYRSGLILRPPRLQSDGNEVNEVSGTFGDIHRPDTTA
jgi:hypothetical protein